MYRITSKRLHDYCLLILSLALILTGYGLVTGCFLTDIQTGVVRPEAIEQNSVIFVTRTRDGAMRIPNIVKCVRAFLLESACDDCTDIDWEIEKTGLLPPQNVSLLTPTTVEICRPGDSSITKTTVKLSGRFDQFTGISLVAMTTIAYIPVRFE